MSTFAMKSSAVDVSPGRPLLPNVTGKPSVSSLPVAQKQVLQRLGQLVAWQEKQRATLLKQQQQEIEQLQMIQHKGANSHPQLGKWLATTKYWESQS